MAAKFIKELFKTPGIQRAVKTVFPDPMDHYKLDNMLWDFRSSETLDQWVCVCDKQFGGESNAEFVRSKSGRAVFRGNLSTKIPASSEAKYSGVCAVRSQPMVVGIASFKKYYLCCLQVKQFIIAKCDFTIGQQGE